jgi:hypothetical protein
MYLLETSWVIVSSISAGVSAVVAALYTFFTFRLLKRTDETFKKANQIQEFQLYREINPKLSSDLVSQILDLCMNGKLKVNYDGLHSINEEVVPSSILNRLLLNALEDAAVFWKNNLISTRALNDGFGYKILKVDSCDAVRTHIRKIRLEQPTVYSDFEQLYKAVYEDSCADDKNGYFPTLL